MKTRNYEEYKSMSFIERASTGCPGSPHRFFDSSFDVRTDCIRSNDCDLMIKDSIDKTVIVNLIDDEGSVDKNTLNSVESSDVKKNKSIILDQVVHQHANNLCIVTAGEGIKLALREDSETNIPVRIVKIESMKEGTSSLSVGGKRKKKAKMSRESTSKNVSKELTHPSDTLCKISLSNGKIIELKSCVIGTILEINPRAFEIKAGVEPLITSDPLMDGFLAVIMPLGTFPPPGHVIE